MLERIDSPDDVIAFRAVGTIERTDYETVLEPAVRELVARHGALRLVYVLGDDFDGYSFGAEWEDAKLGIGHLTKWERCAVVTTHEWVRHLLGAFRWMMPGDLRVFEGNDPTEAIAWATS